MKTSKLFTCSVIILLALFLYACKSDSKDAQTSNSPQTQRQKPAQTRTTVPKALRRDTLDAATNAKIEKMIENTNRKIEQTEKEVDKLLEGI